MKSRFPSVNQVIQRALQMDLFSDFLVPDSLRQSGPATVFPPRPSPVTNKHDDQQSTGKQPPRSTDTPQNKRRILIDDQLLEYDLQRSTRRSIGFLINANGLRITAPRWVTIADIENAIQEKRGWIQRKLNERKERVQQQPKHLPWGDGSKLRYLGEDIIVRMTLGSSAGTHFNPESRELTIHLPLDGGEQQLKARMRHWLQQEARRVFLQRLPIFAEQLHVRYHSMSLSSATTRWGSCNSAGKIRLNWRLIHFSPMMIDYVVAHELAHLREMNHSPQFWAIVKSVFPEVESARRQLRQHNAADLPKI
ncbi:M48 family metallopeptidase [Undibacterium sp. SXout7W]|uniref:M48 family metallopeptidase n=1 Tax=Undibacterium sp. SXout7W TaxID=3413049 RepID=UPI003BF4020B